MIARQDTAFIMARKGINLAMTSVNSFWNGGRMGKSYNPTYLEADIAVTKYEIADINKAMREYGMKVPISVWAVLRKEAIKLSHRLVELEAK